IWPDTKEYRLYRNVGTNDDPKYATYESLRDEKGTPLKLQADSYLAYAPQCGISVVETEPGKRDIVVEGFRSGDLLHARHVKDLRFKSAGLVGGSAPFRVESGYRYFFIGDVDGDGIPDLLNCASSSIAFFKGTHPSAPAAVTDLAIESADRDSVKLRWS